VLILNGLVRPWFCHPERRENARAALGAMGKLKSLLKEGLRL